MNPLTIITGASRGMGQAMALQLLNEGHDLLCISRHPDDQVAALGQQLGRQCVQWCLDLGEATPAAERLEAWLRARGAAGLDQVNLINNAARIPRIAPLGAIAPDDIAHALRVGLEAPMALTGAFLRATEAWPVPRSILNISSGLGRRPMASQAVYCALKAGMDHFSRCVALEEAARPGGARICSLAPGVIDTDMQLALRSTPAGDFPDQQGFENLKRQGQLASPAEAAARVLAWLHRPDFGASPVADIRD